MSNAKLLEPEGAIEIGEPASYPQLVTHRTTLPSLIKSVTLVPLSSSQIDSLYTNIGGVENAHLWQYIGAGPYHDIESFSGFIKPIIESQGNVPFTVMRNGPSSHDASNDNSEANGTPVGIISLGPINLTHRTAEIGILLSPSLQRTTVATEAMSLLLKHCFDDLGYRKLEWKTNNLNEASKRAAVRLGFVLEAVLRKHMIVQGSRDTAWYSITDDDWAGEVKQDLGSWLNEKNFDENGKQVKRLEEFRA